MYGRKFLFINLKFYVKAVFVFIWRFFFKLWYSFGFLGKLINHKWENAMTVDKLSWGYRRSADIMDYLTIQQLLYQLVSTVR